MQEITAYNEFRAKLSELRSLNESLSFDYEDPKGNKEARSHIYKLRKTKSAVEQVRKKEKAESLEYGRRVDSEAKEIMGEIEGMIEVHQAPIDEIEQREKDRIAKHEQNIEYLLSYLDPAHDDMSSNMINNYIHELEEYEPDESYEEYTDRAIEVYKKARDYLVDLHAKAAKSEAEQAELARLRAEAEERERKDREERIAREAAENAKREAEEAAKAEREAAIRREEELKLKAERAEREANETEERMKREAEEQKRREEQEAEKREQNKKHKAKINNAAVKALLDGGMDEEQAKMAITLIAKREVPNVIISY